MDALGRWRESNPHISPSAKISWLAPGRTGIRTWVGVFGGHVVATIKRQPGHVGSTCTATLDGWVWEMSKVPNPMQVTESTVRGFESIPAAKKAIAAAIRAHPTNTNRDRQEVAGLAGTKKEAGSSGIKKMTRSKRKDPDLLPDGDYWATCRERDSLSAAMNGHGEVFPQTRMKVEGGWAYFYRDGQEVWSCNVRYAATNFIVQNA